MAETRPSDSAKSILRYFMRNQEAADTYEGIVRWRLREEAIYQATEETRTALDWLVARGFLRKVRMEGGLPLFRLNLERRAEVEVLLNVKAEGAEGE